MKYILKSSMVHIGGVIYRKKQGKVFDTSKEFKKLKPEVEAACKAGYLEEVKEVERKEPVKKEVKKVQQNVKK